MRLLERFEHEKAAAEFLDFRPTLFFGVPTMYVRLLETPPETAREIGRGMRLFVSRLRAAAGAGARRIPQIIRAHDSRTLRHDRNHHEHLESLRWRTASRKRRISVTGRTGSYRRAETAKKCRMGKPASCI